MKELKPPAAAALAEKIYDVQNPTLVAFLPSTSLF